VAGWCLHGNPNRLAVDFRDDDLDTLADHDAFADSARNHQHGA
jgi:hypothetical protein